MSGWEAMQQGAPDPFFADQRRLHPLGACAFCGSRTGLYTTYLLSTRSMAAVCVDPVECLRRKRRQ